MIRDFDRAEYQREHSTRWLEDQQGFAYDVRVRCVTCDELFYQELNELQCPECDEKQAEWEAR
jgi:rubrerythrin